jgi:outer membrane protein OmpA-like peptidoglycan-associated protein/Tfp pilus assembly protein PilF
LKKLICIFYFNTVLFLFRFTHTIAAVGKNKTSMKFSVQIPCIFLIALLSFANCKAQSNLPPGTYTSINKKAIKQHEEGVKNFQVKKDKEAEKNFLKALEYDPNFVETHMALGYLYTDHKEIDKAIEHFKKATEINSNFFPNNYFDLGSLYMLQGKYSEARAAYEAYLKYPRINPNTKERAEKNLENAKFGENALKSPYPFKPVNVGPSINTPFYEYFPSITADGSQFLFTRNMREGDGQDRQEDFYISQNNNGKWTPAVPIKEINSEGNEGAPNISPNGRFMFLVLCPEMDGSYGAPGRKGYGHCDIFFSEKINGKWSEPINVGPPINTSAWETQPSFSSDGKTLYFIRGTPTREGMKYEDIYMSEIGPDGTFGEPVKLGPNVNSDGKEESVYIHPDNMTLYFGSNGRPGMGGTDIYMSKRQPDGTWGPAVNLGYPINTFLNENSLLVGPNGDIAYFASERPEGYGGLDIYQFDMPESFKPEKITYAKGKVYDSLTRVGLEAEFELIDLESQKSVLRSNSAKDGNFLITLTANHDYLLNVSRKGYLYYSNSFSLKGVVTDYNHPFMLNVPLQPIGEGEIELKGVFFDVDKYDLKPQSMAELKKLADFLKKNPSVKGQLEGHTDNTGNKQKNQVLSENRAKSVYNWLITEGGIDKTRLSFVGYGDTKPKFPNDSDEHKAANRRTVFKMIK